MPRAGAEGRWYSYAEQARHFREAARDRGCTCPDSTFPHTHLIDCPLYSPAADAPSPDPAWSAPSGASPVSSMSEGETMLGGAGKDSPPPGAGAFFLEDGPAVWEREEDHAEERHWERP